MKAKIFSDYDRLFDHDVFECDVCQPKDDHFLDGPCPECGHTWDDMVTIYGDRWKTFVLLCRRCRIACPAYSGSSSFSFDQANPGPDLSGYRIHS